jgi:hypothetical protein
MMVMVKNIQAVDIGAFVRAIHKVTGSKLLTMCSMLMKKIIMLLQTYSTVDQYQMILMDVKCRFFLPIQ